MVSAPVIGMFVSKTLTTNQHVLSKDPYNQSLMKSWWTGGVSVLKA